MFVLILDFLQALPVLSRLVAFFRKSDAQKAKDVEVEVDTMSDGVIEHKLRDEWTHR